MKTAIVVGATLFLAIVFELIYEWFGTRIANTHTEDSADTMERSMNDGCQTSIRLLVFGVISGAIVLAVVHSLD